MNSLTDKLGHLIKRLLQRLGLRTIKSQYTFSYLLIFLLTAVSATSLYLSLGSDATAINIAGRQRMLLQKAAKEVLLVNQGVMHKDSALATIKMFEDSHRNLMDGNSKLGLDGIKELSIRQNMDKVHALWEPYHAALLHYLDQPNGEDLDTIKSYSLTALKQMNDVVGQMESSSRASVEEQQTLALSMSVIVLILVVAGRYFGMVVLMHEVENLRTHLRKVESGDFTSKMTVYEDDEMGQSIKAFNAMVGNVGTMVERVAGASQRVGTSGENLSNSADRTLQGVQQQQSELDQVATAMNEMAATVREVASNAGNTAEAATHAMDEAGQGKTIVHNTSGSIRTLAGRIREAAEVMQRLEADSREVSQVLTVINGVAEQTNLLALNAAIEAARAGEQGRGFAVVADEVRTLAQRTQQSTEEIRAIIEQLQDQSQHAAKIMSDSDKQMQTTLEESDKAREALDRIVTAVTTITDMSNQIATAAEQQSHVAEEVDRSITRVASLAEDSTGEARETVVTADEIIEEMDELKKLIEQFHTTHAPVQHSRGSA